MKRLFVLMGLAALAMVVVDAEAFRVTTADPGGADCELREINSPTSNRGTSTEIASRVYNRSTDPTKNRNSLVYLKFGVANISAADLAGDITVRTTYRNTNLVESRFYDPVAGYTGWNYYVLDPTVTGADWGETVITPDAPGTPPGYYYDGDPGTKGIYDFLGMLNPGLTYLGQKLYDSADLVGAVAHLPVGGAFDFTLGAGSLLHQKILEAQATDHKTLTIVMTIAHDDIYDPANPNPPQSTPSQWVNFNYLFNPKEMATLNNDPDSYWSAWSNANHDFSPMLTNEPHIPEPATIALLGLGGLLLRRKR